MPLALVALGCGAGGQVGERSVTPQPAALRSVPAVPPPTEQGAGWSLHIGGELRDTVAALAQAPDGAVVIAGQFEGMIQLGSSTLVSDGETDVYLAVLESDGSLRWAERVGGAGFDAAGDVAIGKDGDILLVGDFTGDIEIGDRRHQAPDESEVFVASYAPSGAPRWSHAFGGPGWQIAAAIAATPSGQVVVAYNAGELALSELGAQVEVADAAIAFIDGAEGVVWRTTTGGSGEAKAHDVGVTADGGVVLAGSQTSLRDRAGLLARYSPSGELEWERLVGNTRDAVTVIDTTAEPLLFAGTSFDPRLALDSTTAAGAELLLGTVSGDGERLELAAYGTAPATARRVIRMGSGVLVAGNAPSDRHGDGTSDAVVALVAPGSSPVELLRVHGTSVSVAGVAAGEDSIVLGGTFLRKASSPAGELVGRGGLDGFVIAVPLDEIER